MRLIKIYLLLLTKAGFASFIFFSGLQAASYSSQIVGMKFARTPFPDDYRMNVLNMMREPGGEAVLLVRSPGRKIIGVDKRKTGESLMSWRGQSRKQKDVIPKGQIQYGLFPKISKDALAALVSFKYKLLPDARGIYTRGVVFLKTAAAKINVVRKDFRLKAGSTLKAGPVKMTFMKSGKPPWGKDPLEITFDVTGEMARLAEIRFFHADGREIKSGHTSSMSMSMGAFKKVSVSYRLAEKVDTVMIKAAYWDGYKVVKVPFAINVKKMF